MSEQVKKFGTSAVYFTAIATLFGAILFLRFGFAVGTVGLWGVFALIILGNMVTIPTAMAISELATNKRVEGGGEYFIISRSFGLNIGGTLGIMLYLSQTISVAFYIIAFTEAFGFFFDYMSNSFGIELPRQVISVPVMLLLSALVIVKGANMGMKALYLVVGLLILSLILFFLGKPVEGNVATYFESNSKWVNSSQLFVVFSIIFPAFTGMTAGVGLSGDLKKPGKSIPLGTTAGTLTSFVIYFFIAYKLATSASSSQLLGNQLIMADIALFGSIIVPLGLAASTFSSALGSVMVGPRTLQAIALDNSIPIKSVNKWLSKTRNKDNEPVNSSIITCLIALVFVSIGGVDVVAQIITMFFLVTYGSLCLISFLNHFGSSPSYRPSFKSKWYISFLGFLTAVWVMFQISLIYTLVAFTTITLIYLYMDNFHKERKGFAALFANSLFKVNRDLQIYLQKKKTRDTLKNDWRPSAICISKNTFKRSNALNLIDWISYKYGFGTYLHLIDGYFSRKTSAQAEEELKSLVTNLDSSNHVYIDTIISPSTTSAIAQSIQIPGIAGMENNMVIFEFDKYDPQDLNGIIDNFRMVNAGGFDVCILASSHKPIVFKNGVHIWVRSFDTENTNLMILLGFIILGHPNWKKANIKLFNICSEEDAENVRKQMIELVETGRLPITPKNVEVVIRDQNRSIKEIICTNSHDAGLTMIGFNENSFNNGNTDLFDGYDEMGNILFVHSNGVKEIE
ncbi:MAG: amino acid permease [Fermentimonas sp.]|nr:amino acid permease [Fermentimonas sp.]MDD4696812.1 amino acid permease [Fermentimonas sp.]